MPSFERHNVIRTSWEAFLTLLVAMLLSYTWMFADISVPNERSRVYLASALAEHGRVDIDTQVARWGKIYDLAKRDEHYYSDKAPGSSMIAAVLYKVALMFSDAKEWSIQELINFFRTWLMIPISLGGFLVLRRILEYLGLDPPAVEVTSLAWILGTAAFHYGAAFFGHQIVAVALLASLYCILKAEDIELDRGKSVGTWMFAAGALAGIAGLTEYQAAIPCVLLLGYAVTSNEGTRNKGVIPFIAGAAPFALLLLWYNDQAFGGPFELSYHYLVDEKLREVHGQGIAGVTIPTWEYFWGSMFSLHRGLFTTSPLHLAILPGLYFMWRLNWYRMLGVVAVTFVYFVAFVSSSNMWFAGWGFGPRLLVPAMGLFAIPVGFAVNRALRHSWTEGLVKGLAVAGILYHQIVVAFFPEPPDNSHNPLLDFVGLQWAEKITSPNLGVKLFELETVASLQLLALLVGIAIVILVGRGFREIGWVARANVVGLTLAVVLACGAVVHVAGPSWDEHNHAKWTKLLKRWQAREPKLDKSFLKKGEKALENAIPDRDVSRSKIKQKAREAGGLIDDM